MKIRLIAPTLLASALLLPVFAHADFNYGVISYTDIADTFIGSAYTQMGTQPAINNAGQVAFSVLARTSIRYLYITPVLGGPMIKVTDGTNGTPSIGNFTLNNAGTAVFGGYSSAGANAGMTGIFTGNGGAITTVADSTTLAKPYFTGGTPRISDTGSVVFTGRDVGSTGQQIVVQRNGAYSAVATYNGSQFAYLYDAAINNSGQVGFLTGDYSTGNNNGAYVYRANPGGAPVKIGRAVTSTSVDINNSGAVAFQAAAAIGNGFAPTGLVSSDGLKTTFISKVGQFLPGTNIKIDGYGDKGNPINSFGMVAMLASDNSGANYGIYVGDGVNTQTIIRKGQTLFGKTVRDFTLGRDSINDSGQVTFSAIFDDNTYAVVVTSGVSAVPEPSTAVLMSLGGLACVALRRRRSVA